MDENKNPTILTVIAYFAFLIGAAGCLYLFLLGASGHFDSQDPVKRKPVEISASHGRNHTSGHGYYLRRAERGR